MLPTVTFTTQSITIGESANTLTTGLAEGLAALGMGGSSNTDATGYLNFMLFDKQFKLVTVGFRPFTSSSYTEQTIEDITIEEPGYLITYLSYESTAPDRVFFDDFSITLETSTVIQQDNYFPFGMSQETYVTGDENLYKYNGFEEQQETGLYDYIARQYDPALGRFTSVDPAADLMRRYSTYAYAFDNPIRFVDPDGMVPTTGDQDDEEQNRKQQQQGDQQQQDPPKKEESLIPENWLELGVKWVVKKAVELDEYINKKTSTPEFIDAPASNDENGNHTLDWGEQSPDVSDRRIGSDDSDTDNNSANEEIDTNNAGNESAGESKAKERTFVRTTTGFFPSGRIEIDSTFREGDSTYTETWLYKDAFGKYPNKKIK